MDERLMHIYYGYGKGKTTAAVGLACRAANRGMKVLFSSFLKGKDSGEFFGNVPFELDEFDFCNKFWNNLTDEEKYAAKEDAIGRIYSISDRVESYDMIVLDELLDAVLLGCLNKDLVVKLIKSIYGKCEIVITGHERVEELFEMADYITEMKCKKHPYDKGIAGRKGIEF